MKTRLLRFSTICIFLTALLFGCKDDDSSSPVLELKAADQTYSLKDARIFLTSQGETEGGQVFLFNRYVITDGEIVSGNGFSKDDYENASYYLILQLGIPEGTEWSDGEFMQYNSWGGIPSGVNVSYLTSNFDWDIDRYYTTHSTEHAPVIVSGGFEPGEKLSIKFEGNVQYHRLAEDHETWIISNEPCVLKFTGKVIDKRS